MTTYVYRNGELVLKHLAAPLVTTASQSSLGFPMFISDHIDDVRSMATGKYYESKSSLRAEYKALGYIELGNDAPKSTEPVETPHLKNDVVEAYRSVRSGYKPSELQTGVLPDSDF